MMKSPTVSSVLDIKRPTRSQTYVVLTSAVLLLVVLFNGLALSLASTLPLTSLSLADGVLRATGSEAFRTTCDFHDFFPNFNESPCRKAGENTDWIVSDFVEGSGRRMAWMRDTKDKLGVRS